MGYRYIAAGISILNDIVHEDGAKTVGILGGCGIFAWSAISLFTDSCVLVTSGGDDFFARYGPYLDRNGCSREGTYITMPHTHHTRLVYSRGGKWTEESIWGDDYFAVQSENCRTSLKKLAPFLSEETRGIYLDSNAFEGIFSEMERIRRLAPNARILWEPPTMSSKDPSLRETVRRNILLTDAYSMSLDEASAFFATDDEKELIARIIELGRPCFLRRGVGGASWIENGSVTDAPAFILREGIDPTGCGNTSSAASLYLWREGYGREDIVRYANAAASLCTLQYGPAELKYPDGRYTVESIAAADV